MKNPEVAFNPPLYIVTKCFLVEFAALCRFLRTLPHYPWLPQAPSPLQPDREAALSCVHSQDLSYVWNAFSLLSWWGPSLLSFMELIRSHLLLNLPQITENAEVGPCPPRPATAMPLEEQKILHTKARGYVPHILHFCVCVALIFVFYMIWMLFLKSALRYWLLIPISYVGNLVVSSGNQVF